ncbi:MAG: hypothetical protein ACTTGX_02800 [Candidatus Cryptobacteroides sp.]
MLPGDGITVGNGKDKTCFTTDAQYAFQHTGLNTSEIKEYIRNPHKFNTKWEMDGVYYNLWSTDNDKIDANDDLVIKSVYDPSPVGYSLPASNAFTGFTTTGQNVGEWNNPATPEDINAKQPFDKGWYFYTKPNKKGNLFWFPTIGFRHYNSGKMSDVFVYGFTMSAGTHNLDGALVFKYFLESEIFPINTNYRNHACQVRSAEEKIIMVWLR